MGFPGMFTTLTTAANRAFAAHGGGRLAGDELARERARQDEEMTNRRRQLEFEAMRQAMADRLAQRNLDLEERRTAATEQSAAAEADYRRAVADAYRTGVRSAPGTGRASGRPTAAERRRQARLDAEGRLRRAVSMRAGTGEVTGPWDDRRMREWLHENYPGQFSEQEIAAIAESMVPYVPRRRSGMGVPGMSTRDSALMQSIIDQGRQR